jgi:hypothetical protein
MQTERQPGRVSRAVVTDASLKCLKALPKLASVWVASTNGSVASQDTEKRLLTVVHLTLRGTN